MKIILLFIICFGSHFVNAQLKGNVYQFPERFSSNYFFDPNLSYLKIKDVQVKGFTPDQMEFYKVQKTYNVQRRFDNNNIYLEWYDLEKYLYKLVDSILPVEFKIIQPFDIFIVRNADYNASALGNGFVYANIGLIANCENEAQLAYVLGHEIGHSYFNHGYMINSALVSAYNRNDISNIRKEYFLMFEKSRNAELQSDSFAFKCLNKAVLNTKTINQSMSIIEYSENASMFYVNKSRRGSYKAFTDLYSTHPNAFDRKKHLQKFQKEHKNHHNNYIIDSVYFHKVKKIAQQECKKIAFEEGDFETILKLSFVDYLLGDKGMKNMFYLIESIRRYIYANPKYTEKGFLAEDLQYSEFEYVNYSVLHKPEILFIDSLQFAKASTHSLLANTDKPFNTYEEAYFYFANLGEEMGLNEANFSKALYYYFKKDETKFRESLLKYLEKGGGIYSNFAQNLKENGYPNIKDGKTSVLIDNSTNYSENDNYYHSLQRISSNNEIKDVFIKDTSKIKLTLLNELLGIKPKELYYYQKLKWNIEQLYTEIDEELFYKKKYLARETMDDKEKRNRYNKNMFVYIPEWYNWFKENNFNGFLYQKIKYEYPAVMANKEYHNYYYIGYFNCFDNRPFFAKCIRSGTIRKQTNKEMASDLREYLFYKD